MVVGADDKVELRTLVANQAIGNKWLVTEGLKAGDRLIVSGLQKIRPGVQVKVQEVTETEQKAAPADTAKKS